MRRRELTEELRAEIKVAEISSRELVDAGFARYPVKAIHNVRRFTMIANSGIPLPLLTRTNFVFSFAAALVLALLSPSAAHAQSCQYGQSNGMYTATCPVSKDAGHIYHYHRGWQLVACYEGAASGSAHVAYVWTTNGWVATQQHQRYLQSTRVSGSTVYGSYGGPTGNSARGIANSNVTAIVNGAIIASIR